MNNEIKEILQYMKQYVKEPNVPDYNGEYPQPWEITIEEVQCILDYITNLQEIEKEHKNCTRKHWQSKCAEHYINEKLLQSRIDKAVEYITTEQLYTNYQWGKSQYTKILRDLLNILNGDEVNE